MVAREKIQAEKDELMERMLTAAVERAAREAEIGAATADALKQSSRLLRALYASSEASTAKIEELCRIGEANQQALKENTTDHKEIMRHMSTP